jgi:hypothetical protein
MENLYLAFLTFFDVLYLKTLAGLVTLELGTSIMTIN